MKNKSKMTMPNVIFCRTIGQKEWTPCREYKNEYDARKAFMALNGTYAFMGIEFKRGMKNHG